MEAIIERLTALEAEIRNKQVINKELLTNAHTDIMRNYLKGKQQIIDELLPEVQAILRMACQPA